MHKFVRCVAASLFNGGGGRGVPAARYSEPLFRVQLQQQIIDAEC